MKISHNSKQSDIMMKVGNAHYSAMVDLPNEIALFPLAGALLLPKGYLPLNIFEPRYLEMVDDAMRGNRLIGMIQPFPNLDENHTKVSLGKNFVLDILISDDDSLKSPMPLYKTGCIGRISHYSEIGDGRVKIGLQGICRFHLVQEKPSTKPYRIASIVPNSHDLIECRIGDSIDRNGLLNTFENYLNAHNMEADWDSIMQAPTEALVNALSIIAPFGIAEKQALLEAPDIATRAQTLIALTERSLMQASGNTTPLN